MSITIAFDTETTGLDLYHDARPFFVTMCIDDSTKEDWEVRHWEWNVDPKTRIPHIPVEDVYEIRELINCADTLVGQNLKFDITALEAIGVYVGRRDIKPIKGVKDRFPWHKVEDTLIAGHMLYSARKHDLTSMVKQYLNDDLDHPCDIEPLEITLREHCEKARRETRKKAFQEVYGEWKIATKGQAGMPSAKGKCWKYDTWLPLAMALECEYPPDHPYYTVLEEYANADSEHTLALWYRMKEKILQRKLWKIYRSRMEVYPVGQRMERASVTGSITRARTHKSQFEEWRAIHIEKCTDIADEYGIRLKLPNSGTTKQLSSFVFDTLNCPVITRSAKTGEAGLDKDVLEHLQKTAQPGHQLDFLTALQNKRKCDTAISYLDGYEKFWIPTETYHVQENKTGSGAEEESQGGTRRTTSSSSRGKGVQKGEEGRGEAHRGGQSGMSSDGRTVREELYFRMHPFLNMTGTVQLRWSSSNPNEQNISKQEGYNLRWTFGPGPDREWWSLDYENLELKIPTFESNETALMEVFLRPKDPPYFGSYHLAIFDVLHPEEFKEHGKAVKEVFESTFYQWIKNGNFAMIYGCGRRKADATFKVEGAYEKLRYHFPNIAKLSDRQIAEARKYGYVQTIPDKTVDPERGFPIMASRTDDGGVLPTTPLNYHVSGTACQCTAKAMVRSEACLEEWERSAVWRRRYDRPTIPAHMKMQVHDELVFDFPKSKTHPKKDLEKEKENKGPIPFDDYKSNLGFVRVLQKEMEKSGDDISIPLTVGVEYNEHNWSEVTLKC